MGKNRKTLESIHLDKQYPDCYNSWYIFFGKKGELRFDKYELIIISLIILILTVYAYLWINENLKSEKKIRDQLGLIFEKELNYLSIKDIQSDKVRFGYK
jgi:hypothetical protein